MKKTLLFAMTLFIHTNYTYACETKEKISCIASIASLPKPVAIICHYSQRNIEHDDYCRLCKPQSCFDRLRRRLPTFCLDLLDFVVGPKRSSLGFFSGMPYTLPSGRLGYTQ